MSSQQIEILPGTEILIIGDSLTATAPYVRTEHQAFHQGKPLAADKNFSASTTIDGQEYTLRDIRGQEKKEQLAKARTCIYCIDYPNYFDRFGHFIPAKKTKIKTLLSLLKEVNPTASLIFLNLQPDSALNLDEFETNITSALFPKEKLEAQLFRHDPRGLKNSKIYLKAHALIHGVIAIDEAEQSYESPYASYLQEAIRRECFLEPIALNKRLQTPSLFSTKLKLDKDFQGFAALLEKCYAEYQQQQTRFSKTFSREFKAAIAHLVTKLNHVKINSRESILEFQQKCRLILHKEHAALPKIIFASALSAATATLFLAIILQAQLPLLLIMPPLLALAIAAKKVYDFSRQYKVENLVEELVDYQLEAFHSSRHFD